jgi:hypothetical protein
MTFLECLAALSISVFILASIFSFVVLFSRLQYEYEINIKLTNDARQVIDKLVWGTRAAGQPQRRGISEASQAVVAANQIDYVDAEGVTHTVRSSNGNIEYRRGTTGAFKTLLDPNGTPAFDPSVYSTSLTFSQANGNPRTVAINLIMGKRLQGRWYYASLSTTVFFRNS